MRLFMFINRQLFKLINLARPKTGMFTDERDGREYKWARIGSRRWMAENLAFMPYLTSFDKKRGIFVYGYYDTDVDAAKKKYNYQQYGCLYDYETAQTACPPGWRLPTLQDFESLRTHVGGASPESFYRGLNHSGFEVRFAGIHRGRNGKFEEAEGRSVSLWAKGKTTGGGPDQAAPTLCVVGSERRAWIDPGNRADSIQTQNAIPVRCVRDPSWRGVPIRPNDEAPAS